MSQRKIIHIDMDAFYASVEQRDRPEYRGRPIAVGYDGPRGVVATASYEARPYGVHSALSSVLAKRLCPELIFVPARFDVYKAVSRQIRAIFGEYTELVEPLSLDEAFLDVSHVRSATLVAREIKARILAETGLTASAGISVNKMLAKIASDYRKPDGLFTIPPERIEEFVAGLPVERFFGIGEVTAEKVRILQEADKIFIDGLKEYGLYDQVWQAGVMLLPVQSVGVMGDERTYESCVALRAVTSTDGMTADWVHLPYDFLAKMSNDIINRVKGINRVVYDISSKPPATIEWE